MLQKWNLKKRLGGIGSHEYTGQRKRAQWREIQVFNSSKESSKRNPERESEEVWNDDWSVSKEKTLRDQRERAIQKAIDSIIGTASLSSIIG